MDIKISPSLLSADFARLSDELEAIKKAGADMAHLDIMDGHFVPNITFGPCVVKSMRKVSDLFFDVHLMISDPETYSPEFAKAGADMITFHLEATKNPAECIKLIKNLGVKCGISIKPGTPAEDALPYVKDVDMVLVMSVEPGFGGQKFMPICIDKIKAIREYADKIGKNDLMIQVDGGIDKQTAPLVKNAGADVLVAGSAVFGKGDYKEAIEAIR